MVSARQARRQQDPLRCLRVSSDRNHRSPYTLVRPVYMPAASEPRAPNHGGVKLLRFARARQCQRQRDEVCSRSRHVVVPTTSLDGTPLTSASEERADRSADQLVENEPGERGAHIPLDGARTSGTDVSFDLSGHLRG